MMSNEPDVSSDWRTYFLRLGPRLILFAKQWLPDAADAEDAVQEAFVRFWRKHPNPDEQHTGLLFAAVRHAALDHLRSEGRRRRREAASIEFEAQPFTTQPETHWFVQSTGGNHALEAALQRLPAEQREVLVLKIWGELTFAQIGEALGSSPNTVASRYRYTLNNLRKLLRPICHE